MAYQLSDNGASIVIASDTGQTWLYKKQITKLFVLQNSTLGICIQDDDAFLIPFTEISSPVMQNAMELRDLINSWITEFIHRPPAGNGGMTITANNGVSIENGEASLGNQSGTASALTGDREIQLNGHYLEFNSDQLAVRTNGSILHVEQQDEFLVSHASFSPGIVQLYGENSIQTIAHNVLRLVDESGPLPVQSEIAGDGSILSIFDPNKRHGFYFSTNGRVSYTFSILPDDPPDTIAPPFGFSIADFFCAHTLSFKRTIVHFAANKGLPILSYTGGTVYTNRAASGNIQVTVNSTLVGFWATFCVVQDRQFSIQVRPGYAIRLANGLTPTRTIRSSVAGSVITICLTSGNEWVATEQMGTWA